MLIQDLNYVENFPDLDIEGSTSAAGNAGVITTGLSFGTGNIIGNVFNARIGGLGNSINLADFSTNANFISAAGGLINNSFAAFAL